MSKKHSRTKSSKMNKLKNWKFSFRINYSNPDFKRFWFCDITNPLIGVFFLCTRHIQRIYNNIRRYMMMYLKIHYKRSYLLPQTIDLFFICEVNLHNYFTLALSLELFHMPNCHFQFLIIFKLLCFVIFFQIRSHRVYVRGYVES